MGRLGDVLGVFFAVLSCRVRITDFSFFIGLAHYSKLNTDSGLMGPFPDVVWCRVSDKNVRHKGPIRGIKVGSPSGK